MFSIDQAVAEIHQPEQMTEKDSLKSDVQLGYETLEGPRKELEPMPDGKNVKEQALDGEVAFVNFFYYIPFYIF